MGREIILELTGNLCKKTWGKVWGLHRLAEVQLGQFASGVPIPSTSSPDGSTCTSQYRTKEDGDTRLKRTPLLLTVTSDATHGAGGT